MAITINQTDKKFYEQLPDGPHQTGDIWTSVPNGGLLPVERSSAILITPACDLQNQKSDTLSFVPILPLYFATGLGVFKRQLSGAIKSLVTSIFSELTSTCDFENPDFRKQLRSCCNTFDGKEKQKANVKRIISWLDFLEAEPSKRNLKFEFLNEKERSQLLSRIVTNAYSGDLHFLPKERAATSYQAVQQHSVCLFRYVLTYPIEIFELAGHCTEDTWKVRAAGFGRFTNQFENEMPIRTLRLQQDMLSDLLTRFVSLFCRIGSEDFSPTCVSELVREM